MARPTVDADDGADDNPASAPNGARRSKRSQSRDIQAGTGPNKRTTRANSRQPDPAQQDAAEGLSNMARGALGMGNGLPSVQETEDPISYAPLNDDSTSRPSQYGRFSVGAASMHSTTFSQEEVAGLDPEAILASLSDLDKMAESILNTAIPPQTPFEHVGQLSQQLCNESDRSRKYLLGRLRTFSRLQGDFGKQTYIDPEHILRRLLSLEPNSELPNAIWRPDDVFYKANLVGLIQVIFESTNSMTKLATMDSLDSQFPNMLLGSLRSPSEFSSLVGQSQLVASTRNLALEIRLQVFIQAIDQGLYDEPLENTLARVFLYPLEDGRREFPLDLGVQHIRLWENALDAEDSHAFYADVLDHLTGLRRLIDSCHDDAELAVARLIQEHSWEDLCTRALSWVQLRHKELVEMIDGRGGVDDIAEYLRSEFDSLQNQHDASIDPAITGSAPLRSSWATNKNIAILKQNRQQMSSGPVSTEAMDPQDIADLQNFTNGDDLFVAADDDQAVIGQPQAPSAVDPARRDRLRALGAGVNSTANQENRRFVDRQPGATRVSVFDDSQQSPAAQDGGTTSSMRKRPHASIESPELSQDDGFEVDTRMHAIPQRAPPVANMMVPSYSDQRNVQPRTSNMRNNAQIIQNSTGQLAFGRNNPEPTLPPYSTEQPHYSGAALLQHATQVARQNAGPRNQARARTKWTDEEDNALINAIAESGVGWTMLKKLDEADGNVLRLRNPEDLRFRARNMKVTFLQAGTALPPGFEDVPLGQKEIDKLPEHIRANFHQAKIRNVRHRA